jgi:hypothetical protein
MRAHQCFAVRLGLYYFHTPTSCAPAAQRLISICSAGKPPEVRLWNDVFGFRPMVAEAAQSCVIKATVLIETCCRPLSSSNEICTSQASTASALTAGAGTTFSATSSAWPEP